MDSGVPQCVDELLVTFMKITVLFHLVTVCYFTPRNYIKQQPPEKQVSNCILQKDHDFYLTIFF